MLHIVLIVRRNNVISYDPKCDALIVCVTFCNGPSLRRCPYTFIKLYVFQRQRTAH